MAWFRNHYRCGKCGTYWEDEWSCLCNDECPNCGASDWSPLTSKDLTEIVETVGNNYVVMRSSESADDRPRYVPLARFPTREGALRFVGNGELT